MELLQEGKLILISYKRLPSEQLTILNRLFRMVIFDLALHGNKQIDDIKCDLLYIYLSMDKSIFRRNTTVLDWYSRQITNAQTLYIYKNKDYIDLVQSKIKIRKLLSFTSKQEFYTVIINRVQEEVKGIQNEELSVLSNPASPRKLSIQVNNSLRDQESKLISLETINELKIHYEKLSDSLVLDSENMKTIEEQNKLLEEQYANVFNNLSESKELLSEQEDIINKKQEEINQLKQELEKIKASNEQIITKVAPVIERTKTPAQKKKTIKIITNEHNIIHLICDNEKFSFTYDSKESKSKALAEALTKKRELMEH